jgi:hypothetical protein
MEQLDEASLEKRLEAQKELVARLISEGSGRGRSKQKTL